MRTSLLSLTFGLALGATAAVGLVYGIDHDPDLAPTRPQVTATCGSDAECIAAEAAAAGITEEDPRWNCLTMGNLTCGPNYVPLPSEKYLPIFGPDHPIWDEPAAYCLWDIDNTTTVVCSDGTVVTS
jgi:hypothetical protein